MHIAIYQAQTSGSYYNNNFYFGNMLLRYTAITKNLTTTDKVYGKIASYNALKKNWICITGVTFEGYSIGHNEPLLDIKTSILWYRALSFVFRSLNPLPLTESYIAWYFAMIRNRTPTFGYQATAPIIASSAIDWSGPPPTSSPTKPHD